MITKNKKEVCNNFWWTFLAYFFYGNAPYLILCQWPSFNIRPFRLKISNNMLLNSCLANWWHHKQKIYLWASFRAVADRGKREGQKNTKSWTCWEQKKPLTLYRKDFFVAAHIWGTTPSLLPKIYHSYPAMMKRGTVIPYLKKIQRIYESRDTPLEFCWNQHFSPVTNKFCYVKKYSHRLHVDT